MSTVIEVQSLRKTYGTTIAVDEVSFEVQEGEIVAIIPNVTVTPFILTSHADFLLIVGKVS